MRLGVFTVISFALLFQAAQLTYAQSLVILDCQGITRAIHETKGAQLNKVEVQVSQQGGVPANGTQVQLTNNVTGNVYTAQASSGSAVFPSVPPGSYSMAVTGSNISVGTITVGSSGLGVVAAGGVVAGGAAAGGGVVAGGVTVVDQVDQQLGGNSSDPTPTPTPVPDPVGTPLPSPTQIPAVPTPTPTICDCQPDAEPTPIDDFFADPATLSPYR